MSRPSVLIVVDRPRWAYHHIGSFVIQSLSEEFDFYLDFMRFNRPPEKRLPVWRTSRWKAAFFDSMDAPRYRRVRSDSRYDIVMYLGWYMDVAADFGRVRGGRVVKGLYTQGFPPLGMERDLKRGIDIATLDRQQFVENYLADTAAVVCGAPAIVRDWASHLDVPCRFANMALDESAYSPLGHRPSVPGQLVVGWTGNPERSFKGFHSHVVPAVQLAAESRPGIVLRTRFDGPLETLPQFYKGVDAVLIASDADAGPSMFIEAALSGVPAVSTPVGVVETVLRDGHNGLLVARDVDMMAEALVRLHDDRDLRLAMGANAREDCIAALGVKAQVRNWRSLLHEVMQSPASPRV